MEAVDSVLQKKEEMANYIDEADLLFPGASKVKSMSKIPLIVLTIFNRQDIWYS